MEAKKIGSFIKQLREKEKWSQLDLANKLYVTQQAISSWENGKSIPDIDKLKSLSEIFNVGITDLYMGEKLEDDSKKNEVIYNVVKDNQKKFKRFLLIFIIITFTIIFLFLAYHFINSYKSIKVYLVGAIEEDIDASGIMITSKDKTYFQINVENLDVQEMPLFYKEEEIYKTEDPKIRFRDSCGYDAYLPCDSLNNLKDDLHLKIVDKNNQIYETKLELLKDFENKKLLFIKDIPAGTKIKGQDNKPEEPKIPEKIVNTFVYENENYSYSFTKDGKNIWMSYMPDLKLFIVEETKNVIIEIWKYFLQDNVIYYEEINKDGTSKYKFSSETDDMSEGKNRTLLEYFQSNYIEEYFK